MKQFPADKASGIAGGFYFLFFSAPPQNLVTSKSKCPSLPKRVSQTGRNQNLALLLLRIASALAFLYHGSAILFGAFGGPGPKGFAAFMHAPAALGYQVGLAQVGGGLAILTGVFFRSGAVCVLIVMLGAIFFSTPAAWLQHREQRHGIRLGPIPDRARASAHWPGDFSLAPLLPDRLRKL